jgi:hypothetical protein
MMRVPGVDCNVRQSAQNQKIRVLGQVYKIRLGRSKSLNNCTSRVHAVVGQRLSLFTHVLCTQHLNHECAAVRNNHRRTQSMSL